jgi:Protein of unknown function (DUF993)
VTSLRLPTPEGTFETYELAAPRAWVRPAAPYRSRVVFAAAHVVADPAADNTPGTAATLDWESTLAYRQHLYDFGFGVAEAMDTSQRGMGLDWPTARELIRRSAEHATSVGAALAAGAGTDQLPAGATVSLGDVLDAYTEQIDFVQSTGAQPIIMGSRHLAAAAGGPDDYLHVYGQLLSQVSRPVILHWLGPAFDPLLRGYWGSEAINAATDTFLQLVTKNAASVDGVKVSLLNADHEKQVRAQLPKGVRLYTGDDFNFPELIKGDGSHHSDALLGVFAAIAPAASTALQALDRGDSDTYDREFGLVLPLARHLFAAPTYFYKTGIAFTSWLCGRQRGFTMVGGLQSARSATHLVKLFKLLDTAQLLPDPELAAQRMAQVLDVMGVRE